MTISDLLSTSVARHWTRFGAEATDYVDPSGFRVRITALWDEDAEIEVGNGFRATANVLMVPASDMVGPAGDAVTPKVGAKVLRNQDAVDGSWEEWQVAPEDASGRPLAKTFDGYWRIPVERSIRPVGRLR